MREPSCVPSLPKDVERVGDSHSLVGCLEGEGTILPKPCKLELLPQPLFLARCQSIKSTDSRFIPVPALYPHKNLALELQANAKICRVPLSFCIYFN